MKPMEGLAPSVAALNGRPALFVAARTDALIRADRVRAWALQAGENAEFVEVAGSH